MTIPGGSFPAGGAPPPALSEWRAAEERLYPVVMLRPDLYQRAIQLVRTVADELAVHSDVPGLVAAWRDAADIVYRASSLALIPLDELDAGLVAGAGFSLRYRELSVEVASADREARIRAVAEAGGGWVLVDQVGRLETAAMAPYSWLEMHVPSGRALRQTIEADAESGAPRYRVEVVHLDPATGNPAGAGGELGVEETFDDRSRWTAAVEAHRRDIEGDTGKSGG